MSNDLPGVPHLQIGDLSLATGAPAGDLAKAAHGKPIFVMLWGGYCGHCREAKPEFLKAFNRHGQKKYFVCAIQTDDMDDKTQKLMKELPALLRKKGIQFRGVPTYLIIDGQQYSEWNGGRSEAAILGVLDKRK